MPHRQLSRGIFPFTAVSLVKGVMGNRVVSLKYRDVSAESQLGFTKQVGQCMTHGTGYLQPKSIRSETKGGTTRGKEGHHVERRDTTWQLGVA
jgi:hypothetical protein